MERRRFSQTMASEWQTAFVVSQKNAMVCLAHCRQELQQKSLLSNLNIYSPFQKTTCEK